jgi:hypothetical protein
VRVLDEGMLAHHILFDHSAFVWTIARALLFRIQALPASLQES